MRDTTVARNYADALFDVGERNQLHDAFTASFEELENAMSGNERMRAFLETPKIAPDEKKRVLRTVLEGRVHPLFLNFIMILLNKRRQRLLMEIGHEYRNLLDERLGRLHVQVTLARQPDDRARADLTAQLTKTLGREAIPHVKVDPDILGGVIVRYGDRVLDGSLRRRMLSLRRRLLDAGLPTNR